MVESTALFDGIQFLIQDHKLIRQLFDRWHDASSQIDKNSIVEQFIREICMHASAEERYLYPLIAEKIDGGKLLSDRNYLDDQLNKEMLQFMLDNVNHQKSDMDKFVFNKTVEKFIQIELEHLQQEEDDVFPRLKAVLTQQELVTLHNDLQTAKNNAPTHPHPMAPMKFGSKIIHPLAGAIDKLLDYGSSKTSTTTTGTATTTLESSTLSGPSEVKQQASTLPEEKPLLSETSVPGTSQVSDEQNKTSQGLNISDIPIHRSDQTQTTDIM
ncbi:hypothetical protein FDP41_006006 [Naegleria fowleri]|uniref:Hemerythrin-like domain-containing protein n=1 Tax=Naegleria fowleri TaxID=5763 RepID=A0A6A5BMG6_NAEFO|nr:uncharacterized protein FDP41_006006 [Naegleria fowleri]KAF0975254.1 hypothetical protein FDP41_006006 [Naegleria fowleri]CAG4709478.1 unnamed protein product [Naegleria fowleri]